MNKEGVKLARFWLQHNKDPSKDESGCLVVTKEFAKELEEILEGRESNTVVCGMWDTDEILTLSPKWIEVYDITDEELKVIDKFHLDHVGATQLLCNYVEVIQNQQQPL